MKSIGSSSLIALLFAATFVAPAAAAAPSSSPSGERTAVMAPDYLSSEPADGEMMDEAPERVEVTFDEPLDQGSVLSVSDECGRKIDGGDVQVQANSMSVGITLTPSGTYKIDYFAKGIGGVTGQASGTFGFMVHNGPSCGKKQGGDHGNGNHGGNNNGGQTGGGNHGGGHSGGGGGSNTHSGGGGGSNTHSGGGSGGSNAHSGGGSGGSNAHSGGGMDHDSMNDGSTSGANHSSMNHSGSGTSSKRGSGKHGSGKHGSGKQGSGKHGSGGAHGLLDILDQNEREKERAFAAGPGGLTAPDGQAVALALALSLLMGVVGGWFLRVSGAR